MYIHIPFCLRKCPYCDFVSYPLSRGSPGSVQQYVDAVLQEASLRKDWLEAEGLMPEAFHSLYIGGGTPSLLGSRQIAQLLEGVTECFPFQPDAEVTLEANPGAICRDEMLAWRHLGINRLSLGVQSLDDCLLARLGRMHTAEEACQTVQEARRAGFANLSLDLMLGLPGQSIEQWQETLAGAVGLRPEHLSCYELTIEESTSYGRLQAQGKLALPPEDEVIAMLQWTRQYLTDSGYEHYEISNYALPGYRSRHNQIYWENRWYLGLGAAAFSYWDGRRWGSTADVEEYIHRVVVGSFPETYSERLDKKGQLGETIMLGLRLREGVSLADLEVRFGLSVWGIWEAEIAGLVEAGLLELSRGRLRLTDRGLLLASRVQAAFL